MKWKPFIPAHLLLFVTIAGCIVGDQVTTLTINPDGSAELVVFRSNLHSDETGDRAAQELADYKASFEARTDDEISRITKVGGHVVSAAWIRQEAPYSNVVHALLPKATALEQYMSENGRDDGYSLTTQFHSDGSKRKIIIRLTMPIDRIGAFQSATDAKQLRQQITDGISETRIAVTKGTIKSARGFTVAADNHSALLDVAEVADALRMGQGKAELSLEWEVSP